MMSRAKKAWQELDRKEQWSIARRVAARRHAEFRRRFRNVESVGVGFRTQGKEGTLTKEVCLRFHVTEKQDVEKAQRIPPTILAWRQTASGRQPVRIPTDVECYSGFKLEANIDLGVGVVAKGNHGPSVNGSVCCMVSNPDYPESRYLLGCHHVFARSKGLPGRRPDPLSEIWMKVDGGYQRVAVLYRYTNLTPGGNKYGMDAALATVREHTPSPEIHGERPLKVMSPGDLPPLRFNLVGSQGVLNAEYVDEVYGTTIPYGDGVHVRLRTALLYRAATGNGMSGAALLAVDGTLMGMHIGRWDTTQGGYRTGHAIPSWELFSPATFGFPVVLV